MLNRTGLNVLLLVGLVLPMVGCGSSEVDSVSISPSAQSLAAGQTVQLTATGTYGHGATVSTARAQVSGAAYRDWDLRPRESSLDQ